MIESEGKNHNLYALESLSKGYKCISSNAIPMILLSGLDDSYHSCY